jgi:hypothetical protein
MRRPDGVTLVAIYQFLVAIPSLIGACAILVFAVPGILSGGNRGFDLIPPLFGVGIALLFVLAEGVLSVVAGWGLLLLKEWARWLAIVLAAFSLLAFPIGTILGALVIWYLLQQHVRAVFLPEE